MSQIFFDILVFILYQNTGTFFFLMNIFLDFIEYKPGPLSEI